MMMSENCLICGTTGVKETPTNGFYRQFDCDVCGQYQISFTALNVDDEIKSLSDSEKAVLCSLVSDYYSINQKPFCITSGNLSSQLKSHTKTPAQILNRLIEFLYKDKYQLSTVKVENFKFWPILQTFDVKILEKYFQELIEQSIIGDYDKSGESSERAISFAYYSSHKCGLQIFEITLTLKGFEVYEELKKGKSKSNQVFMALQYDNELAANFYKNFLTPALKEFKLDLKDLRDSSKIGSLLVAQMEAEIRQSKFLIADITPVDGKHNANVYWEAGLARGLDKPVLYLCEASKFKKLPFDTNGFLHVKYDLSSEEKVKDAIKEIQAKIYNTFPNELVLPDNKVS